VNTLSAALYRFFDARRTRIASAVFFGFVLLNLAAELAFGALSGDPNPVPDLSLGYSAATLYAMIEGFGEAGRAHFLRVHLGVDMVFPMIFGSALSAWGGWGLRRVTAAGSRWRLLNVAGAVAAGFDVSENLTLSVLVLSWPAQLPWLVPVASLFTVLKWTAVAVASLVIVVAQARLLSLTRVVKPPPR